MNVIADSSLHDDPGRVPSTEESPRRIALVAFPGAQILDITGPLEVFASAAKLRAARSGRRSNAAYTTEIVAACKGPLRTSGGVQLLADASLDALDPAPDTLLLAGGEGVDEAVHDRALIAAIRRVAPRTRRLASVCSGSFLLAEAGLLDGRRATTHWARCDSFAARYPAVRVERDPIFVRDGNVYTSAGVTAGMDLALALVEEDLGRELALEVARYLVLFLKRPGGQSQFSVQLAGQLAQRDPLREVQQYVADNPDADLSVRALAARAGMSARNFARVFTREVGSTPARFVEQTRLEAARRQLEESGDGVEAIASSCGFGTSETMRRTFVRRIQVSPADYRLRFQQSIPAAGRAAPPRRSER